MTVEELQEVRKAIADLRFIQAASLVAYGTANDKAPRQYMRRLTALGNVIDAEIINRIEESKK